MGAVGTAISDIASAADGIKASMLIILGVMVTIGLAWYIANRVGK